MVRIIMTCVGEDESQNEKRHPTVGIQLGEEVDRIILVSEWG